MPSPSMQATNQSSMSAPDSLYNHVFTRTRPQQPTSPPQPPPPLLSPWPAASINRFIRGPSPPSITYSHPPLNYDDLFNEPLLTLPQLTAPTVESKSNDDTAKVARRNVAHADWRQSNAPTLRLPILKSLLSLTTNSSAPSTAVAGNHNAMTATQLAIYTHSPAFELALKLVTGDDAIAYFVKHPMHTPVKFVYANRTVYSSKVFRPYDLTIASHKNIAAEHFTISSHGLVHIHPTEPSQHISLSDWMYESAMFNIVSSIRFFRSYLIAKMFRTWHANIRYKVYCSLRKKFAAQYFYARQSFCQPLLDVQRVMYDMTHITLCDINTKHVYLSETFIREQSETRSAATKSFETLSERLEEICDAVCKSVKDRARTFDHRIANETNSVHVMAVKNQSMVAVKKLKQLRLFQLAHANTEADMLGDFIRLVDHTQIEALLHRVIDTQSNLLTTLNSSNKAIFQTSVHFTTINTDNGDDGSTVIQFVPTANDILTIVNNMTDGCISVVDSVERIVSHPKFKPFVSQHTYDEQKTDNPSRTSGLQVDMDIARLIHSDRTFALTKAAITRKITADFTAIIQLLSFLDKHRPVYEYGQSWDLAAYKSKNTHNVDSLSRDLSVQSEWNSGIHRIRDFYDSGIIQAEIKLFKSQLIPVTEAAIAGMKLVILQLFHTDCITVTAEINMRIKFLDEDPITLSQYAAHVQLYERVKREGQDLTARSKQIEQLHSLMANYEMTSSIPPADEVAYDDMLHAVHQFTAKLHATQSFIESKMSQMRNLIFKNITKVNHEIETLITLNGLDDNAAYMDDKLSAKETYKLMETTNKTQINDISNQIATLTNYQKLLDSELNYTFPKLSILLINYERKKKFWQIYSEWTEKVKKWNNLNILQLDSAKMRVEVAADLDVLSSEYNTDQLLATNSSSGGHGGLTYHLISKVTAHMTEWASAMDVVDGLITRSKALSNDHWRVLFTHLNVSYYNNQTVKLKQLRSMNLIVPRTVQLMEIVLRDGILNEENTAQLTSQQQTNV